MEFPMPKETFISLRLACKLSDLKPQTLHNLRWSGRGPRFRIHNNRVEYPLTEFREWLAERDRLFSSSSESLRERRKRKRAIVAA